jgi:hypothetical protein
LIEAFSARPAVELYQLRSRMRVRVGFLQPLDGDMRVNLRGGKTGVTQQCLHAAQVGAAIEQVGGKTVPKFVRADRNRNRCVLQITF